MARNRSLAGSLAGRLSGSLADRVGSGGGPAPFVGIVDALAAIGEGPMFAFSVGPQLKTAGGNLLNGRSAGGGTANIGTDASHVIDALAWDTLCGGNDGFGVTLYDQGGAGRDVTNPTTAEQPKCYDGATGLVLEGGLPLALLDGGDGVAGNSDGWARGDGGGYSATGAVCIFYFGSFTDVSGYSRIAISLSASATQSVALRHPVGVSPSIGRGGGTADGQFQRFTALVDIAELSGYLMSVPSGTPALSATELRQRGTVLSQTMPNVNTLNTNPTALSIGSGSTQFNGVTGEFVAAIGLPGLPSAAALTLLANFDAWLGTLAGRA